MRPPGRVVCFGEAMLRTVDGQITPGGSEYNVACALGKLGTSTSWISALPPDEKLIQSTATTSGVFLELQSSEHPVGTYEVDFEAGTVSYNRSHSAFANLDPEKFDWRGLLTGARWLVTSGINPMLGDGPRAAWAAALTFAELDGTLIALDLNHRPALGPIESLWEMIRPRLRMLHVLVLSPTSLCEIAVLEGIEKPTTYEESIQALTELRRRFLIPHLCCCFKRPEGENRQKRWSVVAHSFGVDSTETEAVIHSPIEHLGGGDAWLAGFIDALMEHGHGPVSPLIGALRGDVMAALSQNTFGDISTIDRAMLDSVEAKREFTEEGNRILII
jgi:sugar/nucleoside kinase (ribokinase family)